MKERNKQMGNIVSWAMRYRQVVFLIAGMLMVAGIYALMVMPKQEFPVFINRQGLVTGVYPGADSRTVEAQLTNPLEKYLLAFPEVNREKTYSHSRDGIVFVYLELSDEVKDKDAVWSKIKHGLAGLKTTLPAGVVALVANDNFGDVAALLITLESDDKTCRELEGYLTALESRLRMIPSVANLRRYGTRSEQISIYTDNDKLTAYGIGSSTLVANLFIQGFSLSGGSVDNPAMTAPVHIADVYRSEQEIAEQIVYTDAAGHIIRVKDIGKVVREYSEADSYISNNGKKCVLLSMEARQGENIIAFGEKVEEVLAQFRNDLPESVGMYRIADQPKVVSRSIHTFLKELMTAIIAVILVTMVMLPFRVAAVAATAIPVTVFITLGVMYAAGIPLNMITLGALIIVLGLVVDDSVVIVDNYIDQLDHGLSRWHAATSSAVGYFKSILSATLAISITFMPFLVTMNGYVYDFLEFFPWTMTIALFVSLGVAMLLIPYIQYMFVSAGLKPNTHAARPPRRSMLDVLQNAYNRLLAKVFEYPKLTLGTVLLSVMAAVILFIHIPQRMMPVVERDQFAVEIYLPQGSTLQQTAQVCDSMENILRRDARVKSVTKFVGTSSPRFHAVYAPNIPSRAYGQFIVNTASIEATVEILSEYTDRYAFYFPEAYVKFKQLDFQYVAAPIEIRFYGENLDELQQQAAQLAEYMHTLPELSWVRTNFEEMLPGVRVEIDPVEAGRLGIKKALVSTHLAANLTGLPVATLWEDDYPVPVVVKSSITQPDFNRVGDIYIAGVIPGASIPLRQIADIKPEWTQGQIAHRNGTRQISVLADMKWGENLEWALKKVEKHLGESILPTLPEGMMVETGGMKELDTMVVVPMVKAIAMSIFIIFMILVFHFRKLKLALLTLASAVLSLFGAAFGVWVMGTDFCVTSMLGIVTLVGIIVRNGIIMFDYAEELRKKQRLPVRQAAFEAGKRRLRPIFLTSSAAAMGVLPMMISHSLLLSPLGIVIFFGTLISMIWVVTVLPIGYWMMFRRRNG
ncbi:MAG: efflux RND transporter permease subunit [Bacteroidales bacterium]|nr:efflux RND transporter permease subunit [Bacteroidales bacterium]